MLTLVIPVGTARMAATTHTRQVTFLAWEVVQRYCALMGCTTA